MAERQGIEIDHCPACRGIWLDRGELDKLLDRVAAASSTPTGQPDPFTSMPTQLPIQHVSGDQDDRYAHGHRKPKKSWLQDFFD